MAKIQSNFIPKYCIKEAIVFVCKVIKGNILHNRNIIPNYGVSQ